MARYFRVLPSRIRDLIVIVIVIVGAFLPLERLGLGHAGLSALPLAVLAATAVVGRRRWPIAFHVVTVTIFVVATALQLLTPALLIPVGVTVYGVTLMRTRRTAIVIALASALIMLVAVVTFDPFRTSWLSAVVDPRTVQIVAVVGFALATGDATRSRRAYLAAVLDRAERAEAAREVEAQRRITEDRLAIARDLHDVVAHQIAVISLHAGVARQSIDPEDESAIRSVGVIQQAARSVLREIGSLLTVLRDGNEESATVPLLGLARLPALLATFDNSGLRVTVTHDTPAMLLSPAADIVAYRAIQEGLTNALKHGSDGRATLSIEQLDEIVCIEISNNATSAPKTSGHGLTGMRERISSVGGTLREESTLGDFRLRISLPAENADAGLMRGSHLL